MEIRNHSAGLRIWHWADSLVVVGLISTFFLRDWMISNSRFLVQKLGEKDPNVTLDASKPFIHELVDRLWAWHIYLGYALTALLILRVVLFFTDKPDPWKRFRHSFGELRDRFDFRNVHSAVVKGSYVLFYVLQLVMVLSGLAMTFEKPLGLSHDFGEQLHEVHEAIMWFFLAFIVAHIVGVFVAENTGDPGIVSSMINGGGREGEPGQPVTKITRIH